MQLTLIEFFKNLHWEYLAKKTFDYVEKYGGVYHLWGHHGLLKKAMIGGKWSEFYLI